LPGYNRKLSGTRLKLYNPKEISVTEKGTKSAAILIKGRVTENEDKSFKLTSHSSGSNQDQTKTTKKLAGIDNCRFSTRKEVMAKC